MTRSSALVETAEAPRLLLVVGEEHARQPLRRILGRCGYSVDCAASGEEALAMLSARHYDALVSDARLPGPVCGLTLLRELRAMGHQLPTVLLTEGDAARIEAAIRWTPAATCLSTPIDLDRLKRVIAAQRSR